MSWLRLHRCLIAFAAALLLSAGPGSPLCTATSAMQAQTGTMAGCEEHVPAKKADTALHAACTAVCKGVDQAAIQFEPRMAERAIPAMRGVAPLEGVSLDPEVEPPKNV